MLRLRRSPGTTRGRLTSDPFTAVFAAILESVGSGLRVFYQEGPYILLLWNKVSKTIEVMVFWGPRSIMLVYTDPLLSSGFAGVCCAGLSACVGAAIRIYGPARSFKDLGFPFVDSFCGLG